MFDKLLRPVKDKVLIPLTRLSCRYLSPNQISILAFIPGFICGLLIVSGLYKTALIFWFLNRILDGLDGAVARYLKKQSDFGAYLDIMLDFTIYAFIPVSLFYSPLAYKNPAALILLLIVFYINTASWMYLSALLEKRKQGAHITGEMTSVTMPEGIIGGTETVIFYTFFILFPAYSHFLFILMAFLTLTGIIQRFIWALNFLKS